MFKQLWLEGPPTTQRRLLDYYFTSYFNAWLDYKGRVEEKRWIVAFAPRLAYHDEPGVAAFFASYPDGRLIQIVRDPCNWYPSALRHKHRLSLERHLDMWCASASSIIHNKKAFGDRVFVLRFEDLVERTEETMSALANKLDIAFDPALLQPTFNGSPAPTPLRSGAGRWQWRLPAEPEDGDAMVLVDSVKPKGGFTPDIEGLAICVRNDGAGYLVASS